jgi:hypothetical protein
MCAAMVQEVTLENTPKGPYGLFKISARAGKLGK